MRFGLERMRRLMTALDSPHERFRSIHVLGSNGKSSTVRMIAALLEGHGLRTGAYLSPHLASWAERVEVGGRPVSDERFAAAIARVAEAAALVDRTLDARRPCDPVRGADRGRLLGAGPAQGRGRGGGGGPRRPLRRDQRDPLLGAGADQRQPRAHALAGPDRDATSPRRSSRWSPRAGPWSRAGSGPRRWRSRSGDRGARSAAAAAGPRLRRSRGAAASAGRVPARELRGRRRGGGGLHGALDAGAGARRRRRRCARPAASRSSGTTRSRSSTARTTRRAHGRSRRRCRTSSAERRAVARDVRARRQGRLDDALDPAAAVRRRRVHPLLAAGRTAAGDAREPGAASAARPEVDLASSPRPRSRLARELAGRDGAVVVTGSIYLLSDLARA